MVDVYTKIARILKTSSEAILSIDQKMSALTGQHDVINTISRQNDQLVDRTLNDLSLNRQSTAEEVYDSLTQKLIDIDKDLFRLLGNPDLSKLSNDSGKVSILALEIFTPPKGLFIKKDKVAALLEKQPPISLLEHFGYRTVGELLDKEGFASVISALRFSQTTEWMHQFFDVAYGKLTPDDFEERDVEIKILDTKWLEVAEKFMGKKFHNVSHLKEYGIIFISPDPIDMPGETLRMFTLLLHYLHEVPFYTGLFRRFIHDQDFVSKLQSLLRGDVIENEKLKMKNEKLMWLVVQRYLAKDDVDDPRLFMPHVNPEAEHWYRVADDYTRLARISGMEDGKFNIGYWHGLEFVGDFFKSSDGSEQLVSFDIIDLIMSVVKRGEVKYLYHQQEALWNKIFSEYMGHEQMNELVEANIIKGFIEL